VGRSLPQTYKDLVHRKLPSKLELTSEAEVVQLSERNLPTVDPIEIIGRTFLLDREVDGTVHCAEVLCRVEQVDGETEQYLVRLGDGPRQELMTYDAIIDALDHQLEREAGTDDDERLWIFKEVKDHQSKVKTWEVLMKWEDDKRPSTQRDNLGSIDEVGG
jgi:hypothetical protein